jgi:hypothetical protein
MVSVLHSVTICLGRIGAVRHTLLRIVSSGVQVEMPGALFVSGEPKTQRRRGAAVTPVSHWPDKQEHPADQLDQRGLVNSLTIPIAAASDRRVCARLSTRTYAPMAAWQARLQDQRRVSRPEYLYIAIIREVVRSCSDERAAPPTDGVSQSYRFCARVRAA